MVKLGPPARGQIINKTLGAGFFALKLALWFCLLVLATQQELGWCPESGSNSKLGAGPLVGSFLRLMKSWGDLKTA